MEDVEYDIDSYVMVIATGDVGRVKHYRFPVDGEYAYEVHFLNTHRQEFKANELCPVDRAPGEIWASVGPENISG